MVVIRHDVLDRPEIGVVVVRGRFRLKPTSEFAEVVQRQEPDEQRGRRLDLQS
jgi:hypothetical protein